MLFISLRSISLRRKVCLLGVLLLITVNKSVLANIDVRRYDHNTDETKFANGTVAGKYSYVDSEGNLIHVKYFADDNSYGVELRSMRTQPQLLVSPLIAINKQDTFSKNRKGESNDNTNFGILNEPNSTVNSVGRSLLVDKVNVVDNDLSARAVGVSRKRVRRNFKKKSRSLKYN